MTSRLRRSVISAVAATLTAVLGACGVLLTADGQEPRPAPTATAALHPQNVYQRLRPAVVDVSASLRYEAETAEGTGFVINAADGLILTNNHVIRDSTSVTVTLTATGEQLTARIVGADLRMDVALLQVQPVPGLGAAPLGNSSQIGPGTSVVAIGNQAGAGGTPALAPGIINTTGQTIQANDASSGFSEVLHDMLQTSARIAPGDSGGPLADATGAVIGMDTAAGDGPHGTRVGYAIPVNDALAAARLIAAGRPAPGVIDKDAGFLAVVMPATAATSPRVQARQHAPRPAAAPAPVSPAGEPSCLATVSAAGTPRAIAPVRSGALVQGALCGTGAAAAGLAAGDVITAAAGRPVTSPDALTAMMGRYQPGASVRLTWVTPAGQRVVKVVQLDLAPAQ